MYKSLDTRPAAEIYDADLSAAVTRFAEAMRGVDADRERIAETYTRRNYVIPVAEQDAHDDMYMGACDAYEAEAWAAWEKYLTLARDEYGVHDAMDARDFPRDAARLVELPLGAPPVTVTHGPDGGWKVSET